MRVRSLYIASEDAFFPPPLVASLAEAGAIPRGQKLAPSREGRSRRREAGRPLMDWEEGQDVRRASFATRASHATQTTQATQTMESIHAIHATQNRATLDMEDCKARSGQLRYRVPGAVNLVIRSDSPRVIETEPENFREVVQRLTGLRKARHLQPRSRPPKPRLRRSSSLGPNVGGKMEMGVASLAAASLPAATPLLKMEDGLEEGSDRHRHREVRIDAPCGFGAECKPLLPPTLRSPDSVLQADRCLDAAPAVWPMPQDFCNVNGGLDLGCRLGAAPAVPSWADAVPFGLLRPAESLQDGICASASGLQEPFFIDQTVNPCGSLWDSNFPVCSINDYSFSAMGISNSGAGLGVPDYEADLQAALRKPAMEFGQLDTAAACKETAAAAPSTSWFWVDGNLDGMQEEVGYMPMPVLNPQPPSIVQLQSTCPWDDF